MHIQTQCNRQSNKSHFCTSLWERDLFIFIFDFCLVLGDHFCLPVPPSPIRAWVSVCCQWVSAYSIRGHTHVYVCEIWNEKLKWKQLCGIFCLPASFCASLCYPPLPSSRKCCCCDWLLLLRLSLLLPLLGLSEVSDASHCYWIVVIAVAVYQSKYFGERVRAALSERRRNRKLPHCLLLCVCVTVLLARLAIQVHVYGGPFRFVCVCECAFVTDEGESTLK